MYTMSPLIRDSVSYGIAKEMSGKYASQVRALVESKKYISHAHGRSLYSCVSSKRVKGDQLTYRQKQISQGEQ